MPAVETTNKGLGFEAPDFNLPDTVSGKDLSLHEIKGAKATIVMFICNHCPFVIHVNEQLVKLANDYMDEGVACIAISSNDIENYPQDAPELMKELAEKENYPFPYLYDETQEVAKAYDAACTPDFSIFDENLNCVYRGQLCDSRPGNGIEVTGESIRAALDAIIAQQEVPRPQKPSIGCSIKWK